MPVTIQEGIESPVLLETEKLQAPALSSQNRSGCRPVHRSGVKMEVAMGMEMEMGMGMGMGMETMGVGMAYKGTIVINNSNSGYTVGDEYFQRIKDWHGHGHRNHFLFEWRCPNAQGSQRGFGDG